MDFKRQITLKRFSNSVIGALDHIGVLNNLNRKRFPINRMLCLDKRRILRRLISRPITVPPNSIKKTTFHERKEKPDYKNSICTEKTSILEVRGITAVAAETNLQTTSETIKASLSESGKEEMLKNGLTIGKTVHMVPDDNEDLRTNVPIRFKTLTSKP